MPNWCYNNAVISGNDLTKFREFLGDGTGLLKKIAPTPQTLVDTVAGFSADPVEQKKRQEQEEINLMQHGAKNWYDWNVQNWGTKWDVDVEIDDISSSDEEIMFSFDSAWAPPINAFIELGNLFPELSIRMNYREDGMGFAGVLTVEGTEVNDDYYDTNNDKEAYRDFVMAEWGDDPFENEFDEDEECEEDEETQGSDQMKIG